MHSSLCKVQCKTNRGKEWAIAAHRSQDPIIGWDCKWVAVHIKNSDAPGHTPTGRKDWKVFGHGSKQSFGPNTLRGRVGRRWDQGAFQDLNGV